MKADIDNNEHVIFYDILPYIPMKTTLSPIVVQAITTVARIAVGLVFIVAALDKIADPNAFAKNILNYLIVPTPMVNFMALVLPWVELLCGVALVLGIWIRTSATIAGALLVVFIIAVSMAMIQGLNINCGCFSQTGEGTKVGWPKVFENIGLTILALWVLFFPHSYGAVENYIPFSSSLENAEYTA